MNEAEYPSCSIAAKLSRPQTKLLYTVAPRNEAFAVVDPMDDRRNLMFATVPHSESNVDC
jgi:hypothetical protein